MQNEDFARWLDAALKQRNWSYRELAKRAGISQPGLSRAISGKKGIGCEMCIKLAIALNVPIETPLHLAGILPPLPDDDSPSAHEAADLVRGLPASKQRIALRFLRSLYDWPDDD